MLEKHLNKAICSNQPAWYQISIFQFEKQGLGQIANFWSWAIVTERWKLFFEKKIARKAIKGMVVFGTWLSFIPRSNTPYLTILPKFFKKNYFRLNLKKLIFAKLGETDWKSGQIRRIWAWENFEPSQKHDHNYTWDSTFIYSGRSPQQKILRIAIN